MQMIFDVLYINIDEIKYISINDATQQMLVHTDTGVIDMPITVNIADACVKLNFIKFKHLVVPMKRVKYIKWTCEWPSGALDYDIYCNNSETLIVTLDKGDLSLILADTYGTWINFDCDGDLYYCIKYEDMKIIYNCGDYIKCVTAFETFEIHADDCAVSEIKKIAKTITKPHKLMSYHCDLAVIVPKIEFMCIDEKSINVNGNAIEIYADRKNPQECLKKLLQEFSKN